MQSYNRFHDQTLQQTLHVRQSLEHTRHMQLVHALQARAPQCIHTPWRASSARVHLGMHSPRHVKPWGHAHLGMLCWVSTCTMAYAATGALSLACNAMGMCFLGHAHTRVHCPGLTCTRARTFWVNAAWPRGHGHKQC